MLQFLGAEWGQDTMAPDGSTGRRWLLRIGLWALLRPKVIADDWVWLVDHSIQIGQCKTLVILGIRLSELPEGRPLCHQDMEPIALVPMTNATKQTVVVCLENGDKRWKQYASQLGQTKFAVQQTELAFLVSPGQRSKVRFMNLSGLVEWGRKTLALLDDPSRLKRLEVSAERVQAKLGWLREFRAELAEWSAYQEVIDGALDFVWRRGLYPGAGFASAGALPARSEGARELREELIAFVRGEALKARFGECFPGTTEVLESCFGKLKALEDGQSKSGFTRLVLSLGAMVSTWRAESLLEALEECPVRDVVTWCRTMLGQSVQSKRKQAYGQPAGATENG
jgi:hypothetical protein